MSQRTQRASLVSLKWIFLVFLAAMGGGAQANVPPGPRGEAFLGSEDEFAVAELLVDAATVAPGDRVRIGVLFELQPGWHIYWQNPGDSGAAPILTWRAEGAEIGPTQWPAPEVFREADGLLTTFGYHDEVLLFSEAQVPEEARGTWRIEVDVDFLACRIACVPGRIELAKDLAVTRSSRPPRSEVRELFERAEAQLPTTPTDLGLEVAVRADRDAVAEGEDVALVVDVVSCADGNADSPCRPWTFNGRDIHHGFFPLIQSNLGFSALGLSRPPDSLVEGARGFGLVLKAHAFDEVTELGAQRLQGLVPISGPGGETYLEIDVPIAKEVDPRAFEVVVALPEQSLETAPADPNALPGPSLSLLWALAFGLVGGLILNLMPCVLPVLAIKIFGIAELAQSERRELVRHGFAYLAGVLLSMAALALGVLILRSAGTAVGWGFQLQDPIFIAVISSLLVVFAMNLFGVFEITLQPSGSRWNSETGTASSSSTRSFLEGALVVAVATPCTAPFLGTAVGFAFASSGAVIFAVFAAIGLGLAAQYVLITWVPGLARFVPRPGAWMLRVRQLLGFSLLGTVVWLAWVAGRAMGADAQALLLAHLIAIALLVWIFGSVQASLRLGWTRGVAVASLVLAGLSLMALPLSPAPRASSSGSPSDSHGIDWRVFDQGAIDRERAAGRPVFVDFTADWCITCQVNEALVLSDASIREELARWDFATFKADWTLRDDAVTQGLAEWGRAGVPLYIVYPADPNEPPQLLSELLTLGETLKAIQVGGQGGGA